MSQPRRKRDWTRREVLEALGLGSAALLSSTSVSVAAFPKGAVIRTVLRDYPPDELALKRMVLPPERLCQRDQQMCLSCRTLISWSMS
jgi:hypothetical protein